MDVDGHEHRTRQQNEYNNMVHQGNVGSAMHAMCGFRLTQEVYITCKKRARITMLRIAPISCFGT